MPATVPTSSLRPVRSLSAHAGPDARGLCGGSALWGRRSRKSRYLRMLRSRIRGRRGSTPWLSGTWSRVGLPDEASDQFCGLTAVPDGGACVDLLSDALVDVAQPVGDDLAVRAGRRLTCAIGSASATVKSGLGPSRNTCWSTVRTLHSWATSRTALRFDGRGRPAALPDTAALFQRLVTVYNLLGCCDKRQHELSCPHLAPISRHR